MESLRQLSAIDMIFLAAENEAVYNHIGALVLLDKFKGRALTYGQFRRYLEQRLSQIPQMQWRLHEVPMGLDLPYYVEDETFSFDRHLRRIAVPAPGDEKALAEVAAYLFSRSLDHRRPLWEVWFIEGLKGGRTAVLQKVHHCMMDGQGATRLGQVILDSNASTRPVKVDPDMIQTAHIRPPQQWEQSVRTAMKYARIPGKSSVAAMEMLRKRLGDSLRRKKPQKTHSAPLAIADFNTELGRDRGFACGSLPLARLKAVAAQHGVTLNDVVMAVIGGALRNYLRERGRLPAQSLRAMMAVSLHAADDTEMANRVTNAPVTLGTTSRSPLARLRAIHREAEQVKQRARAGRVGAMEIFEMMPPALISTINSLVNAEQTVNMLGANLVVSNLRGSEKPQYLAGARVKAIYPLSVLTQGITLNITCISYDGKMHFGAVFDPDLFPEPWAIIDGLGAALDEYLSL